jgi:serine/threonine protein phosphatase PrpC
VRASNEDSITVAGWLSGGDMFQVRRSRHELSEPLLFAVADGLGGHCGGEVASCHAAKRLAEPGWTGAADIAARLAAINAELYEIMRAQPSLLGMGTTVAGLALTPTRAIWFNIGDSRIYCERGGSIAQLSIDDVLPGPRSGIVTQSLGGADVFAPVAPHIGEQELTLPCRWLLCSDGLTDMLSDAEIERMMTGGDENAAASMFLAAMQAGGADNISIVLVSYSSD